MRKGIVISLFDRSGLGVLPYLDAGYRALIVDGQHPDGLTEGGHGLYKLGMWFDVKTPAVSLRKVNSALREIDPMVGVCLVMGYPECTFLTVSGARWLYHPADKHLPVEGRRPHPLYPNRKKDRDDAVKMFQLPELFGQFYNVPWMAENPAKSMLNTRYRGPDHVFNPSDYGGYLRPDDSHPDYPEIYPGRDAYPKETGIWCGNGFVMPPKKPVKAIGFNPGWAKLGGKSTRTKNIRSITPRGFAKAVFEANHKGGDND